LRANRSADQDDVKLLSALYQSPQFGRRRKIGHTPAPGLHAERQFEAIAPQAALIDDRKMAASRGGMTAEHSGREVHLGFKKMVEHADTLSPGFSSVRYRMIDHDAVIEVESVKICKIDVTNRK
jgi:hypothetical protein